MIVADLSDPAPQIDLAVPGRRDLALNTMTSWPWTGSPSLAGLISSSIPLLLRSYRIRPVLRIHVQGNVREFIGCCNLFPESTTVVLQLSVQVTGDGQFRTEHFRYSDGDVWIFALELGRKHQNFTERHSERDRLKPPY
jgi:hypothetical protein